MYLVRCNVCHACTPIDPTCIPPNANLLQQLHVERVAAQRQQAEQRQDMLVQKAKTQLLKRELIELKSTNTTLHNAIALKDRHIGRVKATHALQMKGLRQALEKAESRLVTLSTQLDRLRDEEKTQTGVQNTTVHATTQTETKAQADQETPLPTENTSSKKNNTKTKAKAKTKTKTKTKKTKKAKKKQKGDSAMHIKTDIDDDLDLFMAKLQENNAREAQLQIEDLKKSIGTLEKRLGISNKVISNLKEQNLLLIKKLNSTK